MGWRFSIAIPSAEVTRPEVRELSINQPTTRRLKTSSTTAQDTLPSRVGCSVISVTHNWSGLERAKLRSTKSVGVSTGRGRRLGLRLPLRPAMPALSSALPPRYIPR